ncbi:MAG TPA: site-2 protease family protein [Methanocorpusculum sp.]|nr:site-2 protease family protein [Methanocorpusculum sp.]
MIAVILAVMAYAVLYYWIKTKKILPDVFDFMGPCLLIKTKHVGIFDKFARWKKFLVCYATAGVILTILSGIILTVLFVFSAIATILTTPDPVPVTDMLLIPGINQYVPSTVAVWLSLVLAIIIHECGHGILSRVENIKVKSTGLLACVIPIGAFVEPDEEEVEKSPLKTKLRMYAAGITNNLVFGAICLLILALLLGMVVPGDHPYVSGIYAGYPADEAGVPQGMIISTINEIPVYSLMDISTILADKTAGDIISLKGTYKGADAQYDLTLAAIPDEYASNMLSNTTAGFMGISFADPQATKTTLDTLAHPTSPRGALGSFLYFLVLPFKSFSGMETFSFLTADSPDNDVLAAPFLGYWSIVHFLFWSAWINILLGTFNALPIRAFDGGQMLRDILREFCKKHNHSENIAFQITGIISLVIITLLVLCVIVPYLF